jgi:hypothetical protein
MLEVAGDDFAGQFLCLLVGVALNLDQDIEFAVLGVRYCKGAVRPGAKGCRYQPPQANRVGVS